MSLRKIALAAVVLAAFQPAGEARAQAKTDLSVSRQPGILYMPTHVIEKQKLVEKHAQRLGVPGVTVKWVDFANGGAQQDALVSGNVDMINTGTGQLLILWDRTRGGVRGIVASSAQPLTLVTREAHIRTLADLKADDKIAVPTVRISTQAILLQMAAAQMYGPDQWGRFDNNTVQLGHPDAFAALRNATHEVRSHFAAPPFHHYELKTVPGARVVIASPEIIGGPLSQAQFMTTTRFADANPKIVQALRAAAEEAKAFIERDTAAAVEIYKEVTGDRTASADLLELLASPGMMEWNIYPQGTMKFAAHLNRVGAVRTMPTSWKDYYLPIAHDLPGS